jgi:hypothetical protein
VVKTKSLAQEKSCPPSAEFNMQCMASKMLSLSSYSAEYGNASKSYSSCTFMRTHKGECVVNLARIVPKAGQPTWLVVQYDPEDNECSHDHVWIWHNLLTHGLRAQAVVFPRVSVVAEVLSALLLQSLEGSTGITQRGRSPAPGMLTLRKKHSLMPRKWEKI